jgi:hypothetical protein
MLHSSKFKALWLAVPAAAFLTFVSSSASADPIGPGFDLFSTPEGGAAIDIGPLLPAGFFATPELVPFEGNPIGPGNTDTIVQRLDGLDDGETGTIPIELVALSLVSVDPVQIGPSSGPDSFFDVFVTLDPNGPASMGQLTVQTHENGGGTFDSFFDVFVEITFVDIDNPQIVFTATESARIASQGSEWSHTRPPGYPVDAELPSGGFYPGPIEHTGPHRTTVPAKAPEPGTFGLFGIGLLGLLLWRRRVAA